MMTQINGLIGANGILPSPGQLSSIAQALPDEKYWHFSTLFWFDALDTTLTRVCVAGILAAC
jgi:hypothetical protein